MDRPDTLGALRASDWRSRSVKDEIRANLMVNAGARAVNMGGSTGFQFFRPPLSPDATNAEARDIRVVANLIEGSEAALAFVGCVDCLAAHNTIVDPGKWMLRILQETTSTAEYEFAPVRDAVVINNLDEAKAERLRELTDPPTPDGILDELRQTQRALVSLQSQLNRIIERN